MQRRHFVLLTIGLLLVLTGVSFNSHFFKLSEVAGKAYREALATPWEDPEPSKLVTVGLEQSSVVFEREWNRLNSGKIKAKEKFLGERNYYAGWVNRSAICAFLGLSILASMVATWLWRRFV